MIDRLRGSEFMRHNAIYFAAAIVVGGLNYLYYPILGRLLEPTAFGEVQTLVSLFLQATAYLTVMGLVTIHIVANRRSSAAANYTVGELEKLSTLFGLVVLAGTIVFGGVLRAYFQFSSGVPFVLLAVAVVITVPYLIRSAYVNGKKLFGLNAWSSIAAAAGKLVLSAAFVAAGFGVGGAMGGIIVAQVVALGLAAYFAHKHGFRDHAGRQIIGWPDFRALAPELKYAALVLVGSLSITILYSVDIVIVKHYFDPHVAGLYASVATVARIIFFLTVPISQVLMPNVKLDAQPSANARILLKSGVLLGGITLGILGLFWIAPEFIVGLLMGDTYREYASLLPKLGLAIGIISALNLVTTYYMALRTYAVGVLAVAGVAITYLLMSSNHQSLAAVVNSMLLGTLITTALYGSWIGLKGHVSSHRSSTHRARTASSSGRSVHRAARTTV
jgi:O-antigen/teichoic acid export membrane protein